jgi:hypothetical protein
MTLSEIGAEIASKKASKSNWSLASSGDDPLSVGEARE